MLAYNKIPFIRANRNNLSMIENRFINSLVLYFLPLTLAAVDPEVFLEEVPVIALALEAGLLSAGGQWLFKIFSVVAALLEATSFTPS